MRELLFDGGFNDLEQEVVVSRLVDDLAVVTADLTPEQADDVKQVLRGLLDVPEGFQVK